jgi:hypothetical protein
VLQVFGGALIAGGIVLARRPRAGVVEPVETA